MLAAYAVTGATQLAAALQHPTFPFKKLEAASPAQLKDGSSPYHRSFFSPNRRQHLALFLQHPCVLQGGHYTHYMHCRMLVVVQRN